MEGRRIINIKGMQCPQPLTIVSNELTKLPMDTEFEVVTDDFICFMMVQRLLRMLGEEVRETSQSEDGTYRIVCVRKA